MEFLLDILSNPNVITLIAIALTALASNFITKKKDMDTYKDTISFLRKIAHRYELPANDLLEDLLTELHEKNKNTKKEEEEVVKELVKEKKEEGN